jgi:hypothetical protein
MSFNPIEVAYNSPHYIMSGVFAHIAGVLVEVPVRMVMAACPVPIKTITARAVHEVFEGFVGSINLVNMYKEGFYPLEAITDVYSNGIGSLKQLLKPISDHPYETLSAVVGSYLAEAVVVWQFGITKCNHHHGHGHHEHHDHHPGIFTTDNLILGLVSTGGSFAGVFLYDSALALLSGDSGKETDNHDG